MHAVSTRAAVAVSQLKQLLDKVPNNCERLPKEKSAPDMEILLESKDLPHTHFDNVRIHYIVKASQAQFLLLLPVVHYAKQKSFSVHLRTQLLKGEGRSINI